MSGGVATRPLNRRTPRITRLVIGLGLFVGTALVGAAQLPGSDPRDDKSPRPPAEPDRAGAAKYQIPNKDRAIFQGFRDRKTGTQSGGIVDQKPIASQTENEQEYTAWHEVLTHAAQFPARELEEHAGRDLTRDELVRDPANAALRLELLRFEGKWTKIRRLPATRSLKESGGELAVYEALLIPLDEPPNRLVSFVFTELPEALAAVKQTPESRWLELDRWGIAAGYFFKVVQEVEGAPTIPLLIGKSVSVLNEPPPGPDPKNPAALDRSLRVFRSIRNNTTRAAMHENWDEAVAWNRVLLHARRFSAEELERNARTDLTFYDLYNDGRWVDKEGRVHYDGRRDYKLDLVRLEGRLHLLRKMKPSQDLSDAGVETAYEGWLVPRDEPGANPVCIVFTDLPEGVEPARQVDRWVSFAGYAFKLMQYESSEQDAKDPDKSKWRRAPLLLGRAPIVRPDPEHAASMSWQSFANGATGVVLVLVGTALGLTWWFRRGDRIARREIQANRTRNPFGEPAS